MQHDYLLDRLRQLKEECRARMTADLEQAGSPQC